MINTLKLQGVASYPKDTPIEINLGTKINIFYGYNGSGKSTISNYLQNPEDNKFTQCSYYPEKATECFFVYNIHYIDKNFHSRPMQPSIFNLDKQNIKIEEEINDLKNRIQDFEKSIASLTQEKSIIKENIIKLENDLLNKTWELSAKYREPTHPLTQLLEGTKRSKQTLLDKIKSTIEDVLKNISEQTLIKEAELLFSENQSVKEKIRLININVGEIEQHVIFKETIIPSTNSYLGQLITQLKNADWVKAGLDFLKINNQKCPFCQTSLSLNKEEEIKKIFDQTYDNKITQLNELYNQYKNISDTLSADYNFLDFAEINDKFKNLKAIITNNINQIENKIKTPSAEAHLEPTTDIIIQINSLITDSNKDIDLYNSKIKQRGQYILKLTNDFWQMLKQQSTDILDFYQKEIKQLEAHTLEKDNLLSQLNNDIEKNKLEIKEKMKQTINIEQAIENINKNITSIGITGFQLQTITEQERSYYKIVRDTNDDTDSYKTLSEGEKTLITFLYFLEQCKGVDSVGVENNSSKRIIVIDDPISSLSQNHVYDIAEIIHRNFIEPTINDVYSQTIILTHNLYFFHELIKLKNKGQSDSYQYFRVFKNITSSIQKINESEIKNTYQEFWQLLKQFNQGGHYALVPNTMRNILEYYFGFIEKKETLKTKIQELSSEDPSLNAFYRYLQRGSHADTININDLGTIDSNKYFEKFQKIFEITGHIEHYNKMMDKSE